MRPAFVKTLMELAKENHRLRLLTADLGFNLFEPFMNAYPDQFINAGIAEANMVGVASGLAKVGFRPIIYSIAPFLILRAFEQLKLDIAFHNLNVKIVGVGAGVDYSYLGVSHYSLEDICFISTLPNFRIYNPADKREMSECAKELINQPGPGYLRLATCKVPDEIPHHCPNENGIVKILSGNKTAIFVTGSRLGFFWEHFNVLKEHGAALIHLPKLAPLDETPILEILASIPNIITVEDQFNGYGLSRLLAQIAVKDGCAIKLHAFGFQQKFVDCFGSNTFIRNSNGSSDQAVLDLLKQIDRR